MTDPQRERLEAQQGKIDTLISQMERTDARFNSPAAYALLRVLVKEQADLLLEFAREEREKEAEWWAERDIEDYDTQSQWDILAAIRLVEIRNNQLREAQPAKKGTGT